MKITDAKLIDRFRVSLRFDDGGANFFL